MFRFLLFFGAKFLRDEVNGPAGPSHFASKVSS